MKKILQIISSPRGEASYSVKLTKAIVDQLLATYPDSTVKTVDLVQKNFPHLEEAHLTSFFTPAENHTEKDKAAIRHSDTAIRDIMEADILVIGAPMWNFSIPSSLKAWIDHIVRRGVTFSYSEKGPEGLIKGKKVYVALATGGVYSEGPMKEYDYVMPYLRFMLGFIGLTDVSFVRVEGTVYPDKAATALDKAIASIAI